MKKIYFTQNRDFGISFDYIGGAAHILNIKTKKSIASYKYEDLEVLSSEGKTNDQWLMSKSTSEIVDLIVGLHNGWEVQQLQDNKAYYVALFVEHIVPHIHDCYLEPEYECDICGRINCIGPHDGEESPVRRQKR